MNDHGLAIEDLFRRRAIQEQERHRIEVSTESKEGEAPWQSKSMDVITS
jgi:hypothetical protein